MPVKYWSFAGLVLTYWCNARCASCYLRCSPDRHGWMDVAQAVAFWRSLVEASPHGCRIHLTGGEPFGDWQRLIALCRRARSELLVGPDKVETNAFWATGEGIVRDRVRALDEAGMRRLVISADPFHQQFVPLDRCRLAARVASDVLGPERVQVRWRDWLAGGFDTGALGASERSALFARYAAHRRERLNGRAADALAAHLSAQPAEAFRGSDCRSAVLRSRHVHVDPDGRVMPGTCAGIVVGDLSRHPAAEAWRDLADRHAQMPVVSVLARSGPYGLVPTAETLGYRPAPGYAGKCHLCWDVRRFLAGRGGFDDVLAPAWIYGAAGGADSARKGQVPAGGPPGEPV